MTTTFLPTNSHQPLRKYILGVAALIMLALLFFFFGAEAVNNYESPLPDPVSAPAVVAVQDQEPEQAETPECPEGSYNIGVEKNGEPICKLEPTGCPYGDSIPMDTCDKFAPENQTSQNVATVENTVETVDNRAGK